jgi:hypothetical protein
MVTRSLPTEWRSPGALNSMRTQTAPDDPIEHRRECRVQIRRLMLQNRVHHFHSGFPGEPPLARYHFVEHDAQAESDSASATCPRTCSGDRWPTAPSTRQDRFRSVASQANRLLRYNRNRGGDSLPTGQKALKAVTDRTSDVLRVTGPLMPWERFTWQRPPWTSGNGGTLTQKLVKGATQLARTNRLHQLEMEWRSADEKTFLDFAFCSHRRDIELMKDYQAHAMRAGCLRALGRSGADSRPGPELSLSPF